MSSYYRPILAYALENEHDLPTALRVTDNGFYLVLSNSQLKTAKVLWISGPVVLPLLDYDNHTYRFDIMNCYPSGLGYTLTKRNDNSKTASFLSLKRHNVLRPSYALTQHEYGLSYDPVDQSVLVASVTPGTIDVEAVDLHGRRTLNTINTGQSVVGDIFTGRGNNLEALVRIVTKTSSLLYHLSKGDLLEPRLPPLNLEHASRVDVCPAHPVAKSGLVFGGNFSTKGSYQLAVWDRISGNCITVPMQTSQLLCLNDVKPTKDGWIAVGYLINKTPRFSTIAVTIDSDLQLVDLGTKVSGFEFVLDYATAITSTGVIYCVGNMSGKRGVIALLPT